MTMTKTNTELMPDAAPIMIDLAVAGSLSPETRATIDRLSYAIQHQHPRCDAIGECGHKCGLRAGHPGDIHEEWTSATKGSRFRLTGLPISHVDAWGRWQRGGE